AHARHISHASRATDAAGLMFRRTGRGSLGPPLHNRRKQPPMALVFAVFIIALLVAFLRPEGRARRIARVRSGLARTAGFTKALLLKGTEAADRIAADLAEDHRGPGGLRPLPTPYDGDRTDQVEPSASS